jgi:hypothetical protein
LRTDAVPNTHVTYYADDYPRRAPLNGHLSTDDLIKWQIGPVQSGCAESNNRNGSSMVDVVTCYRTPSEDCDLKGLAKARKDISRGQAATSRISYCVR